MKRGFTPGRACPWSVMSGLTRSQLWWSANPRSAELVWRADCTATSRGESNETQHQGSDPREAARTQRQGQGAGRTRREQSQSGCRGAGRETGRKNPKENRSDREGFRKIDHASTHHYFDIAFWRRRRLLRPFPLGSRGWRRRRPGHHPDYSPHRVLVRRFPLAFAAALRGHVTPRGQGMVTASQQKHLVLRYYGIG